MSAVTGLIRRVGRVGVLLALAAAVVLAVGAVAVYRVFFHEDTYMITAQFPATPGLYRGNNVDVLGVPTGTIVSVTPHAAYVDVTMSLPSTVKIPATARAVVYAPNPISDRFIQLTPAYTHGAVLKHSAVLGLSRTVVPLELDSVFSSLDRVARALGPSGANEKGDLNSALHAFATLANGNGNQLHTAITKVAAALPALTLHPGDLAKLINTLDSLTSKLVTRNDTINNLYGDLSTVTGQFADDRATLSAALTNMQVGLGQVADFIKSNQSRIGDTVRDLDTTMAAILSQQKSLIQTMDTAGLGFQNFNRAIDPHSPCTSATGAPDTCAALWARVSFTSDAWTKVVEQYCGSNILNPLVPIIAANLGLAKASATDTACGAQIGILSDRTGPAGAPKSPDLDLSHHLAHR